MKAIRALLLTGMTALLVAGIASAAGRGRTCPVRGGERLASSLQLTDTQKAQIRGISEKYRPQFEALRTEKLDRDAKRGRAHEIRAKMHSEIAAVLTPAQREKLSTLRNRHEWTRGPRQGASTRWDGRREWTRGRPDRQSSAQDALDRAARELSLTPGQRQKIDAIYARHRDEIQTLVGDARAPKADRNQIRQRAQSLKEKVVGEVRPILMPDQQQKLNAMIERWEKQHQS